MYEKLAMLLDGYALDGDAFLVDGDPREASTIACSLTFTYK